MKEAAEIDRSTVIRYLFFTVSVGSLVSTSLSSYIVRVTEIGA